MVDEDSPLVSFFAAPSRQLQAGNCQAEPEGGSRGLIYREIGTEIIEGLRG